MREIVTLEEYRAIAWRAERRKEAEDAILLGVFALALTGATWCWVIPVALWRWAVCRATS